MAKTILPKRSNNQKTYKVSGTPEHRAYSGAKARCAKKELKRYGGRGIEFRFTSFEQFFAELGLRPSPKHSLDRIDNDGHYEPGNVRWATREEQARNKENTQFITYNGETLSATDWSERLGGAYIVNRRIFQGWCETCAVSVPLLKGGQKGCPHKPRRSSIAQSRKRRGWCDACRFTVPKVGVAEPNPLACPHRDFKLLPHVEKVVTQYRYGKAIDRTYVQRRAKLVGHNPCRGCGQKIQIGQIYWAYYGDIRYHDECFDAALRGDKSDGT